MFQDYEIETDAIVGLAVIGAIGFALIGASFMWHI